jgi:FKBP-type peptidyl-prolyl cis-trans isomerase
LFRLIYFLFLFIYFTSCVESNNANIKNNNLVLEKLDQQKSIETNRLWLKDEIFKIDQFCFRQGWKMLISSSGMRYQIISTKNTNIQPIVGSEVTISYDIRLMDSKQTRCYHSDSSGLAKFKVEQSLIETGINEVVCCLEKGDSAMVILPHHIAHGLTGDSKKIPPLSTVLYFIKLIDVK